MYRFNNSSDSSAAVKAATDHDSRIFVLYVIALFVVFAVGTGFTIWMRKTGNALQDAIREDGRVRVEEAKEDAKARIEKAQQDARTEISRVENDSKAKIADARARADEAGRATTELDVKAKELEASNKALQLALERERQKDCDTTPRALLMQGKDS